MEGMFDADAQLRVHDAIVATTVRRSEETGVIEQLYLKQGSKDPLKFVLSVADTNGIALEGTVRMINDAVKLFMEFNAVPTDASFIENSLGLGKFLALQAGFLGARLESLPSELGHFFPEDQSEETNKLVVARMQELLNPGLAALSVARTPQVPSRIESFTRLLSSQQLAVKEVPGEILKLLRNST